VLFLFLVLPYRPGFIGSHLTDRLLSEGHVVIVLDNFFTGNRENYQHHLANPRFHVLDYDVVDPIYLDADQIYHLACPASPYAPQSFWAAHLVAFSSAQPAANF
jgi:UDP-glucuronate decarboxylase